MLRRPIPLIYWEKMRFLYEAALKIDKCIKKGIY